MKTFFIPSGSMRETLLIGDHLFVNRFLYGPEPNPLLAALTPSRDIQRGDIVVFRSVEEPGLDLVKRCIGLPGDRVEVIEKELYLNDKRVDDDSYTRHEDSMVLPRDFQPRDFYGPVTVPDGHYFCMGDNRDNSRDSRYWGFLPRRYVKGRAFMVYWSYGGETPDGSWRGWGHRLRQLANTTIGFVAKTRWRRTFHLIR